MRELYKTNGHKIIMGVCGGVAEYFSVQPAIVRLITVAIGLAFPWAVIVIYIVAAIILPEKKTVMHNAHIGQVSSTSTHLRNDTSINDDEAKEDNKLNESEESNVNKVPGDNLEQNNDDGKQTRSDKSAFYLGIFIAGVGVVALFKNLFAWFSFSVIAAVCVIIIGILIILWDRGPTRHDKE